MYGSFGSYILKWSMLDFVDAYNSMVHSSASREVECKRVKFRSSLITMTSFCLNYDWISSFQDKVGVVCVDVYAVSVRFEVVEGTL